MTKTRLLYTDNIEPTKAKVVVDMGEVVAVPRPRDLVLFEGKTYEVERLVWMVHQPLGDEDGDSLMHTVTALLKSG